MSYHQDFVERCVRHSAGREIVFWGWAEREIHALEAAGLAHSGLVYTGNRDLVAQATAPGGGIEFRDIGELFRRADRVFVILPGTFLLEQSVASLRNHGFAETDYAQLFPEKGVSLVRKDLEGAGYADRFGNVVQNLPENTRISFHGYGNRIVFGESVRISGKLAISLAGNNNDIQIGDDASFSGMCFINVIGVVDGGYSQVRLGKGVRWTDTNADLFGHSCLDIGDRCSFARDNRLQLSSFTRLAFGEDCMTAAEVLFQGADDHTIFDVESGKNINSDRGWLTTEHPYFRESDFGGHIWFGRRAIVIGSTRIGSGSIVGAGAVLKGKVPNNCAVAGNPARVIRRNIAWSRYNGADDIESVAQWAELTRELA